MGKGRGRSVSEMPDDLTRACRLLNRSHQLCYALLTLDAVGSALQALGDCLSPVTVGGSYAD
jgi:hypothetical protein